MATQLHIRESLLRARDAFRRKSAAARGQDSAALAVWQGGLATCVVHPLVTQLRTDMPAALGGDAAAPPPGWYFRAGLASCMATSIAMEAALRGIALSRLEVQAHSESDARGMLGSADVPPGPLRFWLDIVLESPEAADDALRALVDAADARSPMTNALRRSLEVGCALRLRPGPRA
jgi:uncharacterized OsmC-like protein